MSSASEQSFLYYYIFSQTILLTFVFVTCLKSHAQKDASIKPVSGSGRSPNIFLFLCPVRLICAISACTTDKIR